MKEKERSFADEKNKLLKKIQNLSRLSENQKDILDEKENKITDL